MWVSPWAGHSSTDSFFQGLIPFYLHILCFFLTEVSINVTGVANVVEGDSIQVCVDVANSDQISGTGSVQLATLEGGGGNKDCLLSSW